MSATVDPASTLRLVAAYAAPVGGGTGAGIHENEPVTPASVMKIQIALAAADLLDGGEQRVLRPDRRTPGPVGISLMRDEVRMSVRDLTTLMLTISDNVAADELLGLLGVDRVNGFTARLGLAGTRITSDLGTMLDDTAREAGFADFHAMSLSSGDPRHRLDTTAAFDPARGPRTTAAETVRLLQAIWRDEAASPRACAEVRRGMSAQLTRHRIAAGFGPEVRVAAKSGGLLGLVRNEAGVVTYPDGERYAVAVFTRANPADPTDPATIDTAIAHTARKLVDACRP